MTGLRDRVGVIALVMALLLVAGCGEAATTEPGTPAETVGGPTASVAAPTEAVGAPTKTVALPTKTVALLTEGLPTGTPVPPAGTPTPSLPDGCPPDCAGAALYRLEWPGRDLFGADLSSAYLRLANLKGAYLATATLERAQLDGANLEGAILNGASLRGAHLRPALLESIRSMRQGTSLFSLIGDFGGAAAEACLDALNPLSVILIALVLFGIYAGGVLIVVLRVELDAERKLGDLADHLRVDLGTNTKLSLQRFRRLNTTIRERVQKLVELLGPA